MFSGSVSDLLVHAINYALAKYVNHRQIGNWRAIGGRNFEPTEWAKDERQGSARFSGRSPCNNKKLNGARGTGDRTKAMR